MKIDNLIIDGTNIEFRVFWIARKNIRYASDGERIEIVEKFLPTFKKLIDRFDPTNVYMAWDKKITHGTNFRKELSEGHYKAGRSRPDDIQELYNQEVKLIEVLESFGVKHMFPNRLEADDVVAWLSKELPGNNVVVSADHDLLQLVNERTSVWNLKRLINTNNFKMHHKVDPDKFLIFKAIKGDSSDNIPGIPGYGLIRSARLAEQWETANISDNYREIVEKNIQMMDLDYGYNNQEGEKESYQEQFNEIRHHQGDLVEFKQLCEHYGFRTEIARYKEWKKLFKRNSLVDLINSLNI